MLNKALRFLIVDDEPCVASTLARALRVHSPTVETDPRAAYRRLREREWFDVVVSDARMPSLSGFELLAVARLLPDPPLFVLMSGDDDVGNADMGDLVADATLHKPFSARQLLEIVERLSTNRAHMTTRPIFRSPRLTLPMP